MKTILSLTAIVGSFLTIFAQNQVFFEDFNTRSAPGWVFKDLDGDGRKFGDIWQINNQQGVPVTPISLISRSWQNTPLRPDNTATTPLIDLTNASGEITLSWKVQAAAAAWHREHYAVYVHTTENIEEAILETPIFEETYSDPTNQGTQFTKTVDIANFAGQKIYITIRHYETFDMDYLSIDDVSIVVESVLTTSNVNETKPVQIYPNPIEESFKIHLPATLSSDVKITVSDLTGRVVAKFEKADSYNISSLAKGVYIVRISDGKYVTTQKIIKK